MEPVNLRRNPWTGADQSVRIIGEDHVIPSSGIYREVTLAEVPRQDAETSVRVYEAGGSQTFLTTGDTHVYEGNPNTNYNGLAYFQTGRDGTGLHYRYRPLLAFANGSLPSLVDQVLLRVYLEVISSDGYPNPRVIGVHQVQESWAAGTATWNNQPAHNLVAAAQFEVTTSGWYDVDITSIYQSWFSGSTNYGVMLKDGNDQDVGNKRQFTAGSGNVARLIISEPGDMYSEVGVSQTPAQGQFAINYDLGMLRFNPSDGGKTIYVDYWGTGSILWA